MADLDWGPSCHVQLLWSWCRWRNQFIRALKWSSIGSSFHGRPTAEWWKLRQFWRTYPSFWKKAFTRKANWVLKWYHLIIFLICGECFEIVGKLLHTVRLVSKDRCQPHQSPQELHEIMTWCDLDGDMQIDFPEFEAMMREWWVVNHGPPLSHSKLLKLLLMMFVFGISLFYKLRKCVVICLFVYLFICFASLESNTKSTLDTRLFFLKEATLNGLGPKTRLEAWTPPVVSLNSVSSLGSGWKSHKGHKGSPRWSQRERRLNTEHQYVWFGRAYQGSSSWLILLGVLLLRIVVVVVVVGTFTSACIYMLQWNPAIKMVSRMQLLVLDIWCVHFIFWQSTQSIIVQGFHHNYIGTIPA